MIIEGILTEVHYGVMLRQLIKDHAGPSHVFYLDVPLNETLRRHAERPLATEVSPDKLRQWYLPADTLGVPGEVVLGPTTSVDALVQTIRDQIGPVHERLDDDDRARFL